MKITTIAFVLTLLLFDLNAQLNPIKLGSSYGIHSIDGVQQNQVIANTDLGVVAFIYLRNTIDFGGDLDGAGMLHYSISLNNGSTWTNDVRNLNSVSTRWTRDPQLTIHNPAGNTDPDSATFLWAGYNWGHDGQGWWVNSISTGSTPVKTVIEDSVETHRYVNETPGFLGGLCEGLPGEYWMVAMQTDSIYNTDTLEIFHGVFDTDSNDVNWTKTKRGLNVHLMTYGYHAASRANISFSPDGMTGWIGIAGDLIGGNDSVYNPILIKSTDGGQTWGSPMEVDLRNFTFIKDSLIASQFDSVGNPLTTGDHPTSSFDFDMTVDSSGNPHYFTVIGSGQHNELNWGQWNFYQQFWKGAFDITTTDGGTTWIADYLAPVLTFQGQWRHPVVSWDYVYRNHCQVSRDQDGDRLFFAWVDTDTNNCIWECDGANRDPDLIVKAKRISDEYETCWWNVTKVDPDWEESAFNPTVAPEVLKLNDRYHVPLVLPEFAHDEDPNPVHYYYFGNIIAYHDSDFVDPATLNLSWNGPCQSVAVGRGLDFGLESRLLVYPNPASESMRVRVPSKGGLTKLRVLDIAGRIVLREEVYSNESEIDVSGLMPGVYVVVASNGGRRWMQKFIRN